MNFKIKPSVRIEQSSKKNILINDETGDFYECNETALFLLKKLIKGCSKDHLIHELLENYHIAPKDAHAQVDYCIDLLLSSGILHEQT